MWICGLKADCPADCGYQVQHERTVECARAAFDVKCPYREAECAAQAEASPAEATGAMVEIAEQIEIAARQLREGIRLDDMPALFDVWARRLRAAGHQQART